MFDDHTLRDMLKEHGRVVVYRKKTEGSYNATTGKLNTNVATDYTVRGFFFNFKANEIDGQTIMRTDRRVVLDTKLSNGQDTPIPDTTDQIVGTQDTVNIQRVEQIESNGKVMCYLLHVRG